MEIVKKKNIRDCMKEHLESVSVTDRKNYYKIKNDEQLKTNLAIRLFKLTQAGKVDMETGQRLFNSMTDEDSQKEILKQNINGENIWQRIRKKLKE